MSSSPCDSTLSSSALHHGKIFCHAAHFSFRGSLFFAATVAGILSRRAKAPDLRPEYRYPRRVLRRRSPLLFSTSVAHLEARRAAAENVDYLPLITVYHFGDILSTRFSENLLFSPICTNHTHLICTTSTFKNDRKPPKKLTVVLLFTIYSL